MKFIQKLWSRMQCGWLPRRLRMSTNWWCLGERGILGVKKIKHMQQRNVAPHMRLVVHLLHCRLFGFATQPKPIGFFFLAFSPFFFFRFKRFCWKPGLVWRFGKSVSFCLNTEQNSVPLRKGNLSLVWVLGLSSVVILILIWLSLLLRFEWKINKKECSCSFWFHFILGRSHVAMKSSITAFLIWLSLYNV